MKRGNICLEGWEQILRAYAKQFNITKLKYIIHGGATGMESIRNGMFKLEKNYEPDDIVLIHDAIRPMISLEVISDAIRVAKKWGDATAVIPCAEAMMQTEDEMQAMESYPKSRLKRAQTPQAFRIKVICDLHSRAIKEGITDSVASCTLMAELGETAYFSAGSGKNIKFSLQLKT